MNKQQLKELVESAFEPEHAIDILIKSATAPQARGGIKSGYRTAYTMALCRAILALEKEIEAERGPVKKRFDMDCGGKIKNKIYVGRDVYTCFLTNPDGVILETKGENPILVRWHTLKEAGEDETHTA